MEFKPNPLLYGTNEEFFGSFKLVITMRSSVDHETLLRAVSKAMARYPYFSICLECRGSNIVLKTNPRPVPVFKDGRCVMLGAEESNGHLLTFGCEGRKIILNASHYIADGMGIVPLLKTVLYLYVLELYGDEELCSERINMPDEPVMDGEYGYPFPEKVMECDHLPLARRVPEEVYSPCRDEGDSNMLYSYHLHIPQKAMMQVANPSDGSPVSFVSVMMYRALCSLDEDIDCPVVAHVQHQYRFVLNAPMSRHSLVSYIPIVFPPRMKDWSVERQNTTVRGQIILGSEPEADIGAINRLISVFSDEESMSFEEKTQAVRKFIDRSICGKTFGISYVGKMDWCGLDKHVEDIHVYLGEKNPQNLLLMEVMTIGDDFSITFMQNGRTRRFVDAFAEQLRSFDIHVRVVGEEEYTVCDMKTPTI